MYTDTIMGFEIEPYMRVFRNGRVAVYVGHVIDLLALDTPAEHIRCGIVFPLEPFVAQSHGVPVISDTHHAEWLTPNQLLADSIVTSEQYTELCEFIESDIASTRG